MEISYAADTEQIDAAIREMAAEQVDGIVRLRVQPTVRRSGNYVSWPGVSWLVTCQDADEAIAVREALRAFFVAVGQRGPAAVTQLLTADAA